MTAINLERLIARNISTNYQNVLFLWWPFDLRLTSRTPYAWLRLPGGRYLSFGMEPEYDERLVAQWGPFQLTRQETAEERQDREEAEAEAEEAFMERELHRYTEWHY